MPIDNCLVLFRARVATFSITIEINRRKERYWRDIFPVFDDQIPGRLVAFLTRCQEVLLP